jgi:hypothetical protein
VLQGGRAARLAPRVTARQLEALRRVAPLCGAASSVAHPPSAPYVRVDLGPVLRSLRSGQPRFTAVPPPAGAIPTGSCQDIGQSHSRWSPPPRTRCRRDTTPLALPRQLLGAPAVGRQRRRSQTPGQAQSLGHQRDRGRRRQRNTHSVRQLPQGFIPALLSRRSHSVLCPDMTPF